MSRQVELRKRHERLTTFRILTYGCQMNERDSETMAGLLKQAGYEPAAPGEHPDVIVMNTCCVREGAERKVFGVANELRRFKQANPRTVLAIVGCMPQQKGALERIREAVPHVDVVLGTHNLHRLPEAVDSVRQCGEAVTEVWDAEGEIREGLAAIRAPGVSAWVTVMYGCDNYCSYCIVPYVRGRERSRLPQDIVSEVTELVGQGYREVVLLGQNVNAYGKKGGAGADFADLLGEVSKVDGLLRIRYMTSHPRDFSQKMIDAVASLAKVCEHFHLPVQSGSDRLLRLMNRGYSRGHYIDLVRRIREQLPESSITTDLIVGFPGETEQDHQDTIELVREIRFDSAFTFIYSPRTGTAAAHMSDQVPNEVKKARIAEILSIQNSITQQKNAEMVGQSAEVLVEGPSQRDAQKMSGRTRTNKVVNFTGDSVKPGSVVQVKITSAGTWTLRGRLETID